MTPPDRLVCVIGAGGHAKAVIAALRAGGTDTACAVDISRSNAGEILEVPIIGEKDFLEDYAPDRACIALGCMTVTNP